MTVKNTDDKEAVVMNHPIHKIAFVLDVNSSVCFIVKRTGGKGKFNCHGFELPSPKVVCIHAERERERERVCVFVSEENGWILKCAGLLYMPH